MMEVSEYNVNTESSVIGCSHIPTELHGLFDSITHETVYPGVCWQLVKVTMTIDNKTSR